MTILAEKSHATQNIGLIDRVLRLVIGVAMITTAYYYTAYANLPAESWDPLGSYTMLAAIYPLLTGMLGWEPLYALFSVRSCSDSGRNQCGTFPYQWKSLIGHAPKYCESDAEHSLEACHDEPGDHPRHRIWRVDHEPMLYPDDKEWHGYFENQKRKGKF